MPIQDWKKTYRFIWLCSAGYNLNTMRILFRGMQDIFKIPIKTYIESLLEHIANAKKGTVFAEIDAVFKRYIESILNHGAFILTTEGTGETLWDIDEAIAICILRRLEDYFEEIHQHNRTLLSDVNLIVGCSTNSKVSKHLIPTMGLPYTATLIRIGSTIQTVLSTIPSSKPSKTCSSATLQCNPDGKSVFQHVFWAYESAVEYDQSHRRYHGANRRDRSTLIELRRNRLPSWIEKFTYEIIYHLDLSQDADTRAPAVAPLVSVGVGSSGPCRWPHFSTIFFK